MTVQSSAEDILASCAENIFRTREPPTFVDWLDEHYYLSGDSSNTKGMRWKSHGYQRSIGFVLADLDTPEVNVVKGTQLGLSHEANALALYEVVERGRSCGYYLPRNEDAIHYSGVMLTSSIRDIEAVSAALIVDSAEKKDAKNTNKRKAFKRGQIFTRSAESPSAYDQVSFSTAIQDEASRMPHRVKKSKDHKGESPFDMIKNRMDAEKYRKHICFSSPEEHGACSITELHDGSAVKMQQEIPCPHCDHYQPLEWGDDKKSHGMQWQRQEDTAGNRDNLKTAATAWYKCRSCQGRIDYDDMIELDDERGELRSESVLDDDGAIIQRAIRLSIENECYYYLDQNGETTQEIAGKPYSIGIRQNSMFSRTKTWFDAVKQYLDAVDALRAGDDSKMMAFVKKYLATAYVHVEKAEFIQWQFAKKRVERYCQSHDDLQTYGVPNGVQAVVGWWDLQNGWIQGGYIGYGFLEESWWLRNMIRMGDPATSDSMSVIGQMMTHKFIRDDGTELMPILTGIDSGDRPDLAYDASLKLGRTVVIPTKGASTYGHPMIAFPSAPKQNCKNTFMTVTGPTTTKDLIFGRLTNVEEPGPGYLHFPDNAEFDDEFFRGFTSESKKIKAGRLDYGKDRDRNEPLDIAVGCQAMITIAQLDKFGLKLVQNSQNTVNSTDEPVDTDTTAAIANRWRNR